MVRDLLQYSGLITKTKAMHGRLLTQVEYEYILGFQTVYEMIAFLREQESYRKIYGEDEEIQHRGQVEAIIYNSIMGDFQSFYQFCNPLQRRALMLYQGQLEYKGTELQQGINYFTEIWKKIGTFQQHKMQYILREVFGTQIDWLNIMWMYRAKRFFSQSAGDIYDLLIPIRYKLRKNEFKQIAEAQKIEDFIKAVGSTAYFRGQDALVRIEDEISYHEVMKKMYRRICRKYPASMAPVFAYLYEKEQEIQNLIMSLEGIRYQVSGKDIRTLILRNI